MVLSLFTFFLYGPIFFVAFILSIVAMSQRRVLGGISLLLATLIVPTVLGLILFATRSTKFLDEATKTAANSPASTVPSVSEALTKSFADAQRKADLQTLERLKKAKIEFEQKQLSLQSFKVLSAKFHKAEDAIGMKKPVIDLSIENGTSYPIKRASFRGIINSPGRSVPWIDETFSYEISGGVEPGESADWSLAPNMFSEWGKVDPPTDSIFTVTVTSLEGADGKSLYSGASFDKADAAKLEALESKLSLEAPGPITPPHS